MFLFEFVKDLLMFQSERSRFQFHEEDILFLAVVAAVRIGPEEICGCQEEIRVWCVVLGDPLLFRDKQINNSLNEPVFDHQRAGWKHLNLPSSYPMGVTSNSPRPLYSNC